MEWDPESSPTVLQAAVDSLDGDAVRSVCDALVRYNRRSAAVYDAIRAADILAILRSGRRFGEMRTAARSFIERGQRAPKVQKYYAQALIELGEFFDAETLLEALAKETERVGDAQEYAEARGLLGRVFKQRYVNDAAEKGENPDDLKRAAEFYLQSYEKQPDENLYQGINGVALLARANADGVAVAGDWNVQKIATVILDRVTTKFVGGKADAWDKATAMEACLGLGDSAGALTWLMRYVNDIGDSSNGLERADAFKFHSTYRQLVEVWRLDRSREPGSLLLPPLKAVTLRARDGLVRQSPSEVKGDGDSGHFEGRFGPDNWYPKDWWELGNRRAERIARISRRGITKTIGTGFLVDGENLNPRFHGQRFLVTNSHVISGRRDVLDHPHHSPLDLHESEFAFEALQQTCVGREIVWESPPWAEDTTIISLECPPAPREPSYPMFTKQLPVGGTASIFIIGYPGTTTIQFSFNNNRLLEMNDTYLRYRTPTDGGSSGSPLFDDDWRLVGIHHFTSDQLKSFQNPATTLAANQGIWIKKILAAIESSVVV
jgi:hypothetical protein